jgi:curved DNA-binding protein CbpA
MPTAATARWAIDVACYAAGRLRRRGTPRSLYEVLGLPRDADEAQIKATYRELARQLHPDVNAGDPALAQRLTEVNHAYEILSDQRARAAYDQALASRQTQMRRHYAILAACTAGTFAVTLIAVSLLVRWHLGAARPEAPPASLAGDASDRSAKTALPAAVPVVSGGEADLSVPAKSADEAGWTTFRDPRFAFTLSYPAGVFAFDPTQSDAHMHTFVSRDRRAVFRIVASDNTTGVTLARFRSTLIKKRYAGASFEQTPQRRHWFALGGTLGGEAFLERVTFSCDGKALHGWQMRYPVSQRSRYDELAKLMLRNHPHGNEPAACDDTKSKRKSRKP